jgi:nitrate reductase (cytochrome)
LKGQQDIGYGLRPEDPRQQAATGAGSPGAGGHRPRAVREFVSALHPGARERETGVPPTQLRQLAEMYADPDTKVMSLVDHGLQPACARRVVQQLVYNLHLLTGKISEPGNSPFSLTGQPSACGTAREVGTFAHRLPADMVVTNPEHRRYRPKKSGRCRKAPSPTRSASMPSSKAASSRTACLKVYWTQVTNNVQAGPNVNDEILPGWRNPEAFVIVSDIYPTVSAQAADLVLPAAGWVEKEGAFGNPSGAPSSGISWSRRRARRARTCGRRWQLSSAI